MINPETVFVMNAFCHTPSRVGHSLHTALSFPCFFKETAEMMRDETVAATDVEHVGPRRQHTRHFQRHVVRAANFAPSSHAPEAALDRGQ